ncbi:MAG: hypothetical protein RLZZ28_2384 [Bacteroidota bacterium]|jgi:hypothetical protein
MLIYNVTTKLSWPIHEAWLKWMKEKHIPEILATGCFTDARFVRLLDTDEAEGPTYAVQFFAETAEQYQKYLDAHAPLLRKEAMETWGEQFISFRTLMQVVN